MDTTTPFAETTAPAPAADDAPAASHPPQIKDGVVRLLDLVCHVSVVVGTGTVTVRDCLSLSEGRLLALDQTAGGDLTVMANGVVVAAGEISVDDEHTSIRVTEVAPSATVDR